MGGMNLEVEHNKSDYKAEKAERSKNNKPNNSFRF